MRIYTRTGDGGETGLIDGSRVPKDHGRVAACGEVDELNSLLGLALATAAKPDAMPDPDLTELLRQVQRDLFSMGARLADPRASESARGSKAMLGEEHVRRLEQAIDAREAELAPLRAFILPGGSPLGALLHAARAVCRRAERALVALARDAAVEPLLVVYLNRLSDLLFVLARHAARRAGQPEETW